MKTPKKLAPIRGVNPLRSITNLGIVMYLVALVIACAAVIFFPVLLYIILGGGK